MSALERKARDSCGNIHLAKAVSDERKHFHWLLLSMSVGTYSYPVLNISDLMPRDMDFMRIPEWNKLELILSCSGANSKRVFPAPCFPSMTKTTKANNSLSAMNGECCGGGRGRDFDSSRSTLSLMTAWAFSCPDSTNHLPLLLSRGLRVVAPLCGHSNARKRSTLNNT